MPDFTEIEDDRAMLFLAKVGIELANARSKWPPINSAHEGYAVILEELDEFKEEVWKKKSERSAQAMHDELVQIAAMAARTALDVLGDTDA